MDFVNRSVCPDCKNTGMIKEKDGTCHTCWKCLAEGRLDCHSENLPDTKIRV